MDANPITPDDEPIIAGWTRKCRTSDQDDVAQEIRMAWVVALSRYAPARCGRRTYLNSVARKVVYDVWRLAYRQCRAAHPTLSGSDEIMVDGHPVSIISDLPDTINHRRLTLAYGGAVGSSTESAIPPVIWEALSKPEQVLLNTIAQARSLRHAAQCHGSSWASFRRRLARLRKKILVRSGPLGLRQRIEG